MHYNTSLGWPRNREQVKQAENNLLEHFMGMCHAEPADPDQCLACYAYQVILERQNPIIEVQTNGLDLLNFLEWLDTSREVKEWGNPHETHEQTVAKYLAQEQ